MSSIVKRLAAYGSCDIADALIKLRHPAGGFLSGLQLRAPSQDAKVVGRAHTILFRPNTIAPPVKKFAGHYIDSVTPGSVLFISAPPNIPNAVYGGLMGLRAQTLGGVGAVVDGRIRDLAEHRDLGFPTFCRGVGTTAGQEVCYSSEINVPVVLQSEHQPGVTINPGDLIVGDENGVVCIPTHLEEEVAELVPQLVERDRRCFDDLRKGRSAEEVFKKHRS